MDTTVFCRYCGRIMARRKCSHCHYLRQQLHRSQHRLKDEDKVNVWSLSMPQVIAAMGGRVAQSGLAWWEKPPPERPDAP